MEKQNTAGQPGQPGFGYGWSPCFPPAEALRLADELEAGNCSLRTVMNPAAAELRRQHAEIQRLQDVNKDLLEAPNALVAAHGSILDLRESEELKLARAAIAKGEQA